MTCASERSGIASSGARRSDSQPHAASAPTTRIVSRGLRALAPITRPITPPPSAGFIACLPSASRRAAASRSRRPAPHQRAARALLGPELRVRADPALGGDQEVAGGDHRLAFAQATDHLDAILVARAERDLLRPQPAFAEVEEHEPARPGVDDRADRDLEPRPELDLERDVAYMSGRSSSLSFGSSIRTRPVRDAGSMYG